MAMYFHEGLNRQQLRNSFDAARANKMCYFGVIEQVYADEGAVTVIESVMSAPDCTGIMRQLRENGLRPNAPDTRLVRLMDLSCDFNAQMDLRGDALVGNSMTPEAQLAYDRYLEDVQQKKATAAQASKGLFARIFGKR